MAKREEKGGFFWMLEYIGTRGIMIAWTNDFYEFNIVIRIFG